MRPVASILAEAVPKSVTKDNEKEITEIRAKQGAREPSKLNYAVVTRPL